MKPEPVHDARAEVLDQDVGAVDELAEDLLALVGLHVEGERPLVAVQHREVEAVHVRQVAQLGAGDVPAPGLLDLDHVSSHPGQELGADRAGLHVRHVDDADAFEGLRNHAESPPYLYIVWFMVPGANAFGSTHTLISDGLPLSRARSRAGRMSFGSVTSSP